MTTFIIQFNDLSFDKQQEMISEVKEILIDQYKDEAENGRHGRNFGRKEYGEMTWQEAVVREYSIDYILWETEEEAKKFNWDYAIEQHAEEEAEKKCSAGHIEWEVRI